jgi:AcrR family transcriptional regulator
MADTRPSPLRDRLLTAATELASAEGREAVTVERLAEHAGVSGDQVLALFPDAQSCLLAAYEAWIERGLRALEGLDGYEASPTEGGPAAVETLLMSRLQALFDCLVDRPEVAKLCLVEVPSAGADGQAARNAALGRYRSSLEQQLSLLGAGPPMPRAGEMAAGAIYDVAQRAAHEDELEQLPRLVLPLVRTWAPAFGGAV